MKLLAMSFNDAGPDGDAVPDQITVQMSLAEAAAIAAIFGRLNSYAHQRLGFGEDDGPYDCLTGDVFNRYWDNGVDGVLPGIQLHTLNEPPS